MAVQLQEQRERLERLRALLEGPDEALGGFLSELHAADIADLLEQIEPEQRSRILYLVPPHVSAGIIVHFDEAVRSEVLDEYTSEQLTDVLKELPADDAVDVLDEMDEAVADKLIEHLPPEQQAAVQPLRQYEEDTAGGIMDPSCVRIHADGTVADAIEDIRRLDRENVDQALTLYCVDDQDRLVGAVPPMRLLTARPGVRVRDLMRSDLFTAHVNDDQEQVKNKFEKYDIADLPVVDDENHLLGVITHDDVLEVAEEEAEEDILRMAGTEAAELATSSIFMAASVRTRWLLPSMIGTFSSAIIMVLLQQKIPDVAWVVVPFLIPIAAMGGNAGVQTSTIVVRALATGDALMSRLRTAAARELRIGLIVGVGAACTAAVATYGLTHSGLLTFLSGAGGKNIVPSDYLLLRIAASVGASMFIAIFAAVSSGMTLPFIFRRLGIDPAIATGPLITTANDGLSAAIYSTIALSLLKS